MWNIFSSSPCDSIFSSPFRFKEETYKIYIICIITDSFLFRWLHNINKDFYVCEWKGNFPPSGVSRDVFKAPPDAKNFLPYLNFPIKTFSRNWNLRLFFGVPSFRMWVITKAKAIRIKFNFHEVIDKFQHIVIVLHRAVLPRIYKRVN